MCPGVLKNGDVLTLAPPSDNVYEVKDKFFLVLELVWFHIMLLPYTLMVLYQKFFPPPEKSLKGQVALVTGAGRGLGRGLAKALAKEGCKVAVVDVNLDSAKDTAEEICREGGEAKAYSTNVAKVQDIRTLRDAVTKDFGPVDLLVNNAGLIFSESVEECTEEGVTGVISVNLLSHFWMAREFLPAMRQRNSGHIVCMASASAFAGLANAPAYAASKFGLRGFMESLRLELEAKPANRIKTTTVFPYFINTSADYTDHWDLRLPPMSIEFAVKATIAGIKRQDVELTIPGPLYFYAHLRWFLPQYVGDKAREIIYTRVIPASKEELEIFPNTTIIRDLAKGHS